MGLKRLFRFSSVLLISSAPSQNFMSETQKYVLFDPIISCEGILGNFCFDGPQKMRPSATTMDAITFAFEKFQKQVFPFQQTHQISLQAVYDVTQGSKNFMEIVLEPVTLEQYMGSLWDRNIWRIKFQLIIAVKLKLSEQKISDTLGGQFMEKWTCPVSLVLMDAPIEIQCGHVFSQKVLQDLLGGGQSLRCPLCRKQIHLWGQKQPEFRVCEEMFSILRSIS